MAAPLPLVGMAKERRRLGQALDDREALLLWGPPGSGKTRLIEEALPNHPEALCVAWEPVLHALLASMTRALIAAGHPGFLGVAGDRRAWLAAQTSLHLKGLLGSAFESAPVPMILDGVTAASFPAYRFLQRVYHTPGMALVAASRDRISLGALARLFWDPDRTLLVAPLSERDAGRLFAAAAGHFKLHHLALEEFRRKVLESAGGNPGQIIEMCRLASEPQYVSGRHIKFAPLRIDTLIKFAR